MSDVRARETKHAMNAMELELGLYDWSGIRCLGCKSAELSSGANMPPHDSISLGVKGHSIFTSIGIG
jgi:hypothetical protein